MKERANKENINVYFPPMYLCTDNAGMVAFTGLKRFKEKGTTVGFDFEAKAKCRLDIFPKLIRPNR